MFSPPRQIISLILPTIITEPSSFMEAVSLNEGKATSYGSEAVNYHAKMLNVSVSDHETVVFVEKYSLLHIIRDISSKVGLSNDTNNTFVFSNANNGHGDWHSTQGSILNLYMQPPSYRLPLLELKHLSRIYDHRYHRFRASNAPTWYPLWK